MSKFLVSVFELKVFDESGKLITEIKDAMNGVLKYDSETTSYFAIEQASFDLEMIKTIGEVVENNLSDFEKELQGKSVTRIMLSKAKPTKYYKLIVVGNLFDNDYKKEEFKAIIYKAKINSGLKLDVKHDGVTGLNHVFEIIADENGNEVELEFIN